MKNVLGKESMILHKRMHCTETSWCKLNAQESNDLPNSNTNNLKMANGCFIESQLDANLEFTIDKTKKPINLIFREINIIKMSAVASLEEGKPNEWLSKMHSLLQDLANIEFDTLADMHISSLETRFNRLLYDKLKKMNCFFAMF